MTNNTNIKRSSSDKTHEHSNNFIPLYVPKLTRNISDNFYNIKNIMEQQLDDILAPDLIKSVSDEITCAFVKTKEIVEINIETFMKKKNKVENMILPLDIDWGHKDGRYDNYNRYT
jgi:hypothetical protein